MSCSAGAEAALATRTVALLQARHADVLANLITRNGGRALSAPCLREVRVEDPERVRSALDAVTREQPRLAVFQTGVGVNDLFEIASELSMDSVLFDRLAVASVLARGPKPLAALQRRGVEVGLRTVDPHTTNEVVSAITPISADLRGALVLLQHFGATNRRLHSVLEQWGARVVDLFPYEWALPTDLEPIRHFLVELRAGRVDITVFTSSPQVENLWSIAAQIGHGDDLAGWLASRTVVASIGPTTTRALGARGVTPRIQPERPKMVPLVDAICAFYGEAASRSG